MQYLYIDGYTYRIWAESSLLCTCTHSRIGKLQVISIVVACSLAWIISFSVVLYETHSRLMGAFIVLFLLLFFLISSFSSSLSCYLLQLQRERGKKCFCPKKTHAIHLGYVTCVYVHHQMVLFFRSVFDILYFKAKRKKNRSDFDEHRAQIMFQSP